MPMIFQNVATFTSLYISLTFDILNSSYLLVIGSKLEILQICEDLESKLPLVHIVSLSCDSFVAIYPILNWHFVACFSVKLSNMSNL